MEYFTILLLHIAVVSLLLCAFSRSYVVTSLTLDDRFMVL